LTKRGDKIDQGQAIIRAILTRKPRLIAAIRCNLAGIWRFAQRLDALSSAPRVSRIAISFAILRRLIGSNHSFRF
jgi:hypothetical protein